MTNRAMDNIMGMLIMILFLPVFAVMDEVLFSSFSQLEGLPLGALLVAVIVLIEIVGYLRYFGEAISNIVQGF
jgi:hypothetical protein